MIQSHELTTDNEIIAAFPLMHQLRPHLIAATFLETVRTQQNAGYVLFAGTMESSYMVLAGVRNAQTLMRGPHLFVDDLVTLESERGQGHGTAMLQWLADYAARQGFRKIYLDSRDTAVGFYRRAGFTMTTAVPSWKEVKCDHRPANK